jgi:hypothetical protein
MNNKNMGNKRKAEEEGGLPDAISMDRIEGTGPFAVYFPSGFSPEKAAAECEWETFGHEQKKNQYAVVAKTVRYILIKSDHTVIAIHFYACNTNSGIETGCSNRRSF